jgi:hypothetical protein
LIWVSPGSGSLRVIFTSLPGLTIRYWCSPDQIAAQPVPPAPLGSQPGYAVGLTPVLDAVVEQGVFADPTEVAVGQVDAGGPQLVEAVLVAEDVFVLVGRLQVMRGDRVRIGERPLLRT